MNKTTKILLTISLTSFFASLTGALWGFFLPVGAISLGLFMIFKLLGKETELFDEEQRLRLAKATENAWTPQRSQRTPRTIPLPATSTR